MILSVHGPPEPFSRVVRLTTVRHLILGFVVLFALFFTADIGSLL